MNVGIINHSAVLAEKKRTVEEIVNGDKKEAEHMRNIGLDKVPADNERLLEDMILEAVGKIDTQPDLIIIAHSMPFIFSDWKKFMKDMNPVEIISMGGMPCAAMHAAVSAACKYIENEIYNEILVVGADKAYSDKERCFFHTIMGDGVVALLIGKKGFQSEIISSNVHTCVIAANGENSDEKDIAEFRAANAALVRSAIEKTVKDANLSMDAIDYYIPHTSNKTFWDVLSKLMHVDRDKFLDVNMRSTGHMNSHDSFYHFLKLREDGAIKDGDKVLLVNPGFGGTQGCTLIAV